MNCWSMSCQSKLTPQEHCCFRAPQGETGCPEPQAETSSLRGHQPQVFAARSHRGGHVPCCPCCTADGAMQVPQGHSSSHASLHHLQHPLLLLSPQNTAGSKGKDPSTQPLLEGQSQPPAQGWRRAEHPSQPTQLPAACGSVMKRGHGPLPAGPGALVSFQPGIFLLDLYFFLIPFFFFFLFLRSPKGHAAVGGAGKLSAGRYQQRDSLPGPRGLLQPDGCPPCHRSQVPFADLHCLAWPRCLPLSLLSGSSIPSQERGGCSTAPSPGTATGMEPRAGIPTGWMGSSVCPAWQEPPRIHLATPWGAHGRYPPPASLQTAPRAAIMGWQQSTGEKISHVPSVTLHSSGILQEQRALVGEKSRVLRPEIPRAVSNPLLFTIRK